MLYKSGKNYVGKGGFSRAISSAVHNTKNTGDVVTSILWKAAPNSKTAFIEEYALQSIRGVNNATTYNKIWNPGKKLFEFIRAHLETQTSYINCTKFKNAVE